MMRLGHFPGCPKAEGCTCPPVTGRGRRGPSPDSAEWVIAWHVRQSRESAGRGIAGRVRERLSRLAG